MENLFPLSKLQCLHLEPVRTRPGPSDSSQSPVDGKHLAPHLARRKDTDKTGPHFILSQASPVFKVESDRHSSVASL